MAQAFSIQLICRILGMLASVVSVMLTARYLGPGRYGQLTVAVAFIGMWASLVDLGIGRVIVRRVTSSPTIWNAWSGSTTACPWSIAFR
ncbi:polysaccharide biosynthesis family protein [Mycobacterium ulcerans str. Harvey]|uniref:Polysaccharide biosynthesis family protein n=1 Tax=Mycobacterium ulcerans str. Harvey TaxID=1299332 RepID=A0ABP3A8K1_MYCUL|nr:polysaccharide biosynthesis family protein [Mycobacterium ulcerans str. Harvey]